VSENEISVPKQHSATAYLEGNPRPRIPGDSPAIFDGFGMVDADPAGLRLDLLWRLSDVLDRWISGYGDST